MIGLNNLKVGWKIRILIGMAALALGVFAWVSFSTLRAVEINGPLYAAISAKQDVTQDVNPPVMSLMPTRLQVYVIIEETNRTKRETEIARLHQIRKDYEQMLDDDLKEVGEGKIKDLLTGEVHQSAAEYWDQVDHGLLPLVQKGDTKRSEEFRSKVLVPIAQKNEQAVSEVVKLVQEDKASYEKSAGATVTSRTWLMGIVALGSIALIIFSGYFHR